MANVETKLPIRTAEKSDEQRLPQASAWQPLEGLRHEVDRLFENFGSDLRRMFRPSFDLEPFWRREWATVAIPPVDVSDKGSAFEIAADLPGMDEKSVDVTVKNGTLTIKGEKEEEKEEKKTDYYLKERHFGSFQRSFRIPEGVAIDKIEATFKKGVLTITMPKTVEAQKPAQTIEVKPS